MANIVIRELLPSDTFSALVDKVNYNFDQLLLSGGGPIGLTGGLGDIGPMGISGTRMYTTIDIVDKTTDTPVTPILPGDPNKYYPVAPGATEKIGSLSKPLRHNDLYIEEGDDNTLGNSGLDGDIWIYSVITNGWTKTGNNIKGETGNQGDAGLSEWTRDLTFQSSGRDYLYITDITGVPVHKLVLGSFVNISEDNGSGGTMDPDSIVNITTDISTGSFSKYAISIGDLGANAGDYAKITAYSGILYLKSPNYGSNGSSKSIYIDAFNKIALNSGSNIEYIGNETLSLGSENISSHYFTGAPVNIELSASNDTDFFRVARTGRSAFIVYPTTSTVTDRIHIYPISANISPKNNTNADKDLVIKINSTTKVGLGPILTTESMGAMLSVKGNGIIGPSNTSTPAYPNFFAHNPGFYSFAVYNKIGIGTRHGLDGLNSYNQHGSKLVIGNIGNSSDSPTILLQNSVNGITGLYFQNINWSGSTWNVGVEGSLLYAPSENIMRLAVSGHNNAIHITSDGNVAIDYQMGTPYKLAVSGTARFLCTDSNPNSGFEILTDNHTTEGITDNVRPIRRGLVIGRNEILSSVTDNFGFVNFYKHSSENSSYFHTSDIFPLCIDTVDSSRFNFRTYEHSTPLTLSLMSIRGYDKNSIAVQIGTEYNLDTQRTGITPERTTFKHTALHIRKDTSGNSNILTTILSQNDVYDVIPGYYAFSDIDFYTTNEAGDLYLKRINNPQARIRFKTKHAVPGNLNLMYGNLEFFTSYEVTSAAGDNAIQRTLLLDWEGNVTVDNNLIVGGLGYFNDIWLGPISTVVESTHFIRGNAGTSVKIQSGDALSSSTKGRPLILVGGNQTTSVVNGGDSYLIGGGTNSLIYSNSSFYTGAGVGGNVYIAGGKGNNLVGSVILGENNVSGNSYFSNVYLKGDMFVQSSPVFRSIAWGTTSPTSPLQIQMPHEDYPVAYFYNQSLSNANGGLFIRIANTTTTTDILKLYSGTTPATEIKYKIDGTGCSYQYSTNSSSAIINLQSVGTNIPCYIRMEHSSGVSGQIGYTTSAVGHASINYPANKLYIQPTGTGGVWLGAFSAPNESSVFVKFENNYYRLTHSSPNVTTTAAPSDIRLKRNIAGINIGLNEILKLNAISFNWNELFERNLIISNAPVINDTNDKDEIDGYNKKIEEIKEECSISQIGFIAQEVEEIIPYLVYTGKDGYKKIDYSKLSVILTKSIQEQQKMIEEKDAKIAKLEERLAKIEKLLNI